MNAKEGLKQISDLDRHDKAKPTARWGRKVTGLIFYTSKIAGLPKDIGPYRQARFFISHLKSLENDQMSSILHKTMRLFSN